MTVSQAAVSYSPPFPAFAVEEAAPRTGNGPAFAAAMAQDRPALPKPERGDDKAASPSATEEEAGASNIPADEATTDPEGSEALRSPKEVAPDQDETDTDVKEESVDAELLTPILALTTQQTLPAALRLPAAVETEDTSPSAVALTPGALTITTRDVTAAGSAAPATSTSETSEAAAAPTAEEPIVVSAAQLAFLEVMGEGASGAEGQVGIERAVIAGLALPGLSAATQASRAIAGFGLGLSVVRATEQKARDDQTETASDPSPEHPAVPQVTPRTQTMTAATAPEIVATLTDLTDDTGAAGLTDSFILDGTADALPMAGGNHSAAIPAPSAPAGTQVVATPAQLAPIVATVARQNGPSDITVTLSPDELGTLHMRVSMDGDALRVTLLADRPETLDLLRRHGDQLLTELRNLGFGGASLGFGSSGGGASPQRLVEHPGPPDALPGTLPPQQSSPAPSRMQRAGGIDIRL